MSARFEADVCYKPVGATTPEKLAVDAVSLSRYLGQEIRIVYGAITLFATPITDPELLAQDLRSLDDAAQEILSRA